AGDARCEPASGGALSGDVHRAQGRRQAGRDLVSNAAPQSLSRVGRSQGDHRASLRMMSNDQMTPLPIASTAGAQLRAAREALGLSQDAVAQQLKLAPRQVRAIEEDDYARLPGRTFVRGFVRNYARLVHLDPGAVAAGLPRVDGTSPLDRPSLTTVSRPMAEMPVASVRRQSSTRWLIPIVLLAIVAAAGVYEYTRTQSTSRRAAIESSAPEPSATAPAGQSTTVLPNPLDNAKPEATASATVSQKTDGAGVPPTAVA